MGQAKRRHDAAKMLRGNMRGRLDNLSNDYLGYGTTRDKLAYGSFAMGAKLTDIELHAMYYSDDVAAKIVNARPSAMLRTRYKLTAKDKDAANALQKRGDELGLVNKFLRAMQWGRLYGGALLVFGAFDGVADLSKPLNEKSIKDTKYINVIDRRFATVVAWQENPFLPNYGEPEVYQIGGIGMGATRLVRVHRSRVIQFDGIEETDPMTRRQLGGWTYSVLQRPYDVLRKFATSFDSVTHLMSDASQGVLSMDGLIDLVSSDKETLLTRAALIDMMRSSGRMIMVDAATEKFERVATSFAGLKDVLDKLVERLASAADMPVTLLVGRSPGGMNATGDSDFRAWYDVIDSERVNDLKPALIRAYTILANGVPPEGLDVEFNALWEPTEQEKATTDNLRAQTDKIYSIDIGAVLPEQVAIARFGSGNGKIEIDEAAVKKSLEQEIELMKNPPPPAPVPPPPDPTNPNAPPTGGAPDAPKTPETAPVTPAPAEEEPDDGDEEQDSE